MSEKTTDITFETGKVKIFKFLEGKLLSGKMEMKIEEKNRVFLK